MKQQRWAALMAAVGLNLTLALAGQSAQAQSSITFTGTSSDGLQVDGTIFANVVQQATLQETLSDGTLHNQFLLYPNGVYGITGDWSVNVGGRSISGYDEDYEYGANTGPQVDVYLKPDGQSSLSLSWNVDPICHGGCIETDKITLDLTSTNASLFTSSLDASVFQHYTSGSGFVSRYASYLGGSYISTDQASFTLSAVPEPEGWAMALAGLSGLALVLRRQRRGRLDGVEASA